MARKKNGNRHPSSVEARIREMLQGFETEPQSTVLDVYGVPSAPDKLRGELQTRLARYTDSDAAQLAATKLIEVRDAAEPETLRYLDAIDASLRGHYGAESSDLARFGVKPKKAPRKLTAEERLHQVEQLRKTRAEHEGKGPTTTPGQATGK
jgi:hypothetical protein